MNQLHLSRLSPQRTLSSHEQVVRVLGSEILSGVHAPGSVLPPEAELLARFQVSRTVLREVLKTLAAKGMVVSKTRVGTKVLDPVNWNFFDAEVLAWKVGLGMDEAFRHSLMEVRRAVEPAAAALAARRATEAQIAEMRRAVERMRAAGHTPQSFALADLDFHLAIGAASGNPLMRSMAAVIEAVLIASFSLTSPVSHDELHGSVVDAHEAIVEAIAAADPNRAAEAMLAVIDAGGERYDAGRSA